MSRSFSIVAQSPPALLLSRAKALAGQAGAKLFGDTEAGRFSGKRVAGDYRVDGTTIMIRITDKPFIVPWSIVESKVRAFFG